jgi:hypothetical protein
MDPQIQSPAPDTTIVTPIDSSNDPMPPDVPAQTTPNTTTTTTGPATATPSTPPIVTPPAKKFNPLIIVIVILLLIFLGIGGFLVINMANNKTVPTPVPKTAITVNPAPPADTPTPAPSGNGTISGTICYPASSVPAGKITAKDITSAATTSFDNASDSAKFSVTLPVGSYKLRYEPATDMPIFGYYTTCSGSEPACQDTTTKRSSIVSGVA